MDTSSFLEEMENSRSVGVGRQLDICGQVGEIFCGLVDFIYDSFSHSLLAM